MRFPQELKLSSERMKYGPWRHLSPASQDLSITELTQAGRLEEAGGTLGYAGRARFLLGTRPMWLEPRLRGNETRVGRWARPEHRALVSLGFVGTDSGGF